MLFGGSSGRTMGGNIENVIGRLAGYEEGARRADCQFDGATTSRVGGSMVVCASAPADT
jgi:hypothetical protein